MPNLILCLSIFMMSCFSGYVFYQNVNLREKLNYNNSVILFINSKNEVQKLHPLKPEDYESLLKAEELRVLFIESILYGLLEIDQSDEKIKNTISALKRLTPEVWQQHSTDINEIIELARDNELKQTIKILKLAVDDQDQGSYFVKIAGVRTLRGAKENFIQDVKIKIRWSGYSTEKIDEKPFEVVNLQFSKKDIKI